MILCLCNYLELVEKRRIICCIQPAIVIEIVFEAYKIEISHRM